MPAVPRRHRSYAALRLPCLHQPLLVCLAVGLLRDGRFSSPGRACAHGRAPVGGGSPSLRSRIFIGERHGPPRLPGHPLSRVPQSNTPPGARSPRHFGRARCCLPSRTKSSAPGTSVFRGWFLRPTRSLPYASPSRSPSSAQGLLPTCVASLWSGGFRTRWTTYRVEADQTPFSARPFLVAPYESGVLDGLFGRWGSHAFRYLPDCMSNVAMMTIVLV